MPTTYTEDAFSYRVDFAASVIANGRRATRAFDTCFEMHDGDAVGVALYRRSRRNPKLRQNLWRYVSRSSVVPKAWENRRRPRTEFAAWAAELRRVARAQHAAFMAKLDAERKAKPRGPNWGALTVDALNAETSS